MANRTKLDPVGPRMGRPLHEKKLSRGAVGISLHHHGAVTQMGQQDTADVCVVLQQIPFRYRELWPEYLCQVRQLHLALAKRQFNVIAIARNYHRICPPGTLWDSGRTALK